MGKPETKEKKKRERKRGCSVWPEGGVASERLSRLTVIIYSWLCVLVNAGSRRKSRGG